MVAMMEQRNEWDNLLRSSSEGGAYAVEAGFEDLVLSAEHEESVFLSFCSAVIMDSTGWVLADVYIVKIWDNSCGNVALKAGSMENKVFLID